MKTHPTQPIVVDKDKLIRFKPNLIVIHLLQVARKHGTDMNSLATMNFSQEDRQQFAQLIGYSVGGYHDLSYVDAKARRRIASKYRKVRKLLK